MKQLLRSALLSIAVIAIITLSGCGISPRTPEGQARGIPDDNIVMKELTEKRPGTAEVLIIRQAAMLKSVAAVAPVILDNKLAANLYSGEKVSLWLTPGRVYVLGTSVLGRENYLKYKGMQNGISSDVEIYPDVNRRYTVRIDYTGDAAVMSVSSAPVER